MRSSILPGLIAATLAGAWLLLGLDSVDLVAAEYRTWLFEQHGAAIWNGNWYGGHHTPAYSALFPPAGALIGPRVAGAVAATVASMVFARLIEVEYGAAGRPAALAFAVGSVTLLLSGRMPFALGLALGLGALLAARLGRRVLAPLLAAASSLASPVAGLFMAMAGIAAALGGHRRVGIALAAAALAPVLALAVMFPEGGEQEFRAEDLWQIPLLAVAVLLSAPRDARALRWGALLYGLGGFLAYLVDTPVGSNVNRVYEHFGVALLALTAALAVTPRARLVAVLALPVLVYAQVQPAVRDAHDGATDPAFESSYHRPLLEHLAHHPVARLEIPFTRSHAEAFEVGRRQPLARGWERQLDVERNGLFYDGSLDERSYREWLVENAVGAVAVPGAPLDHSARAERRLIERGLPYLRRVASPGDWTVYRVVPEPPLVVERGTARMRLVRLGADEVALHVRAPGSALVRVRWTPYWAVSGGCVARAGDWTTVEASAPGRLRLRIDFSLARVLDRGRRCG